jgi:hypothetical protein
MRAGTSDHARSAYGVVWYKRDVGLSFQEQLALGTLVPGINALAEVLYPADSRGELPAIASAVSSAFRDAAIARQRQPGFASRSQDESSPSVRRQTVSQEVLLGYGMTRNPPARE